MDPGKNDAVPASNNSSVESSTPRSIISRLLPQLKSRSGQEASAFARSHAYSRDSDEEDSAARLKPDLVPQDDEHSLDKYYQPIDSYEGRHRYDPKATWSKAEEKALIRRLDLRVCAYCCFMFFAL
ncbi:MAG: hypothetical protein HETSPECPRED_010544 [Heterodermia speciosa]|uniref:Uncharacterized protein n=1 Tax=Heterodermia speciosa TaxID=116794 RepID=A0A8H3G727_9LECA|nr:MAG: hypothetical protein HETSPECPRED_010544 [Heterodermia speciosa]